MTLDILRTFLGWCLLLNVAFIACWAAFLLFASEWVYRMHGRAFRKLTRESFDAIHYGGLAFHKIVVIVFCLVPYLALVFMTCDHW